MLPNGIVEDIGLRVNAPERNRRKIQDSGLTLQNGIIGKIRDSGLMLPNGIVDFQNRILILVTIDLLILFKNEGLSRNTFNFLL